MEAFLIGFIGALTGGLILALCCVVLFLYERKQKDIMAEKIVTGFKEALVKKQGKGALHTLYPESDNIN